MTVEDQKVVEKIKKLKKELNAVILAHYYQEPAIQDLGDFVGDSLGLCIEASKTDAEIILFCGVHFMAESAKLLNPDKLVLIPDSSAGCPMADMAGAEELRRMKEQHSGAAVVTYVNSTAAVKAESDICCTSSNAIKIVESIPEEREIIFVPDQNLGAYVQKQTGRNIILWEGYCPIHHRFVSVKDIESRRKEHPGAPVLVHPECPPEIVEMADFTGSTAQILGYCREAEKQNPGGTYIIGTEKGILYPLRSENREAVFIPASEEMVCRNMKKITLEKMADALERKSPEVTVPESIAPAALEPVKKMLEGRGI